MIFVVFLIAGVAVTSYPVKADPKECIINNDEGTGLNQLIAKFKNIDVMRREALIRNVPFRGITFQMSKAYERFFKNDSGEKDWNSTKNADTYLEELVKLDRAWYYLRKDLEKVSEDFINESYLQVRTLLREDLLPRLLDLNRATYEKLEFQRGDGRKEQLDETQRFSEVDDLFKETYKIAAAIGKVLSCVNKESAEKVPLETDF